MSLGKNIQYLRKQKKITQEQLAEIMSVSRQTISRWEADEIVPEDDVNEYIDRWAQKSGLLNNEV